MATSQNPSWVLKKAVLVYTPDFDVSCFARLRIAHDKTANQGSISLWITADLANLTGRSQVLTLNIPPERIEKCALARISNDSLCSPNLVSILRAPVANVSAVSTLSLRLNTTGIVLCPSELKSLCPANPGDSNFHAFAKICQSEFLRLHFSRRQFVNNELDQLEIFSRSLRERSLQTESFDHARHGVVQRDWRAFSLSLDPPPYCEEPVRQVKQVDPPLYNESVSGQVVGKRRRDPWSSPDDENRKRLLLPSPQPIDSPTEVNTPTTLSPSPSIRPTCFTRASSPGRTERHKLMRLEHELRGLSDDLICELLIRSGRQHLLVIPKIVDNELPSESEKVSFAEVGMIERRLKRYVDETIERRLKSHVVDEIVDGAVSEYRDQIFDECKTHECEFREQVDDCNSEVRITANECMSEMKEQAQKHMREIEEQAQQYMNDIEDQGNAVELSTKEKVAKLKQTSLGPSHEGTNARCSSI
ncbi:hypothetical protein P170DRAFT_391273 [Aspergillus steynii IBT 23096]|uniref:Uncharacterized protein n=1 Tax=Aspergillus steynii IBT 23096 TaxID=1392250 RepID=A0A2I2FW41_9EURO|nr:uncharacterized protein P170DRAFT_391273 [Aspergillus steynii IBT 23096]PLB44863.1 hypothetical protein P170DRAFT_391273 [Aspergillus steynii IBT 23096]